MSKLVSEAPFGASMALQMKIGTLVSWAEWMISDNDLIEEVFYGTIVDKVTRIEGDRPVCVVIVACSKTGEILSLNPFQLRLEETN
jgi:hypothetical protein